MEISEAEIMLVVDRALEGMTAVLEDLGDDLANARPDLPGANSPVVIVTHCIGVLDFWVGECVAGRPAHRDRDAEFRASGPVAPLVARVREVRDRVAADVTGVDGRAPARLPGHHARHHDIETVGAAILHAYEELAQHHGQLELTRDVLRAEAARG